MLLTGLCRLLTRFVAFAFKEGFVWLLRTHFLASTYLAGFRFGIRIIHYASVVYACPMAFTNTISGGLRGLGRFWLFSGVVLAALFYRSPSSGGSDRSEQLPILPGALARDVHQSSAQMYICGRNVDRC